MDYPTNDGPNHLGLWYNALPEHRMALITSGCHSMDYPTKHGPNHLGLRCNALPEHQTALITSGFSRPSARRRPRGRDSRRGLPRPAPAAGGRRDGDRRGRGPAAAGETAILLQPPLSV